MRSLILPFAALAAAASPAAAATGGFYLGVEGGASFAQSTHYDVTANRVQTVPTGSGLAGQTVTTTNTRYGNGFVARQKAGADVDAIAGYDFGIFRVEAEVAYKRSRRSSLVAGSQLLIDINTAPISGVTAAVFDGSGHTTVLSGMANALVQYQVMPGVRVYGGGGGGRARINSLGNQATVWAFQGIAGASTPIASNLEIGLKYRYFQTNHYDFATGARFANVATGATSVSQYSSRGRFRSNSLLVSLVYRFSGEQ